MRGALLLIPSESTSESTFLYAPDPGLWVLDFVCMDKIYLYLFGAENGVPETNGHQHNTWLGSSSPQWSISSPSSRSVFFSSSPQTFLGPWLNVFLCPFIKWTCPKDPQKCLFLKSRSYGFMVVHHIGRFFGYVGMWGPSEASFGFLTRGPIFPHFSDWFWWLFNHYCWDILLVSSLPLEQPGLLNSSLSLLRLCVL